jgi:hypothetical protein
VCRFFSICSRSCVSLPSARFSAFFACTNSPPSETVARRAAPQPTMKHPTPEQKHGILTHLAARREGETLKQILALHAVVASRQAVAQWRQQWDGTIASLQRNGGSGRPHALTPAEVQHHIAAPIRRLNRAARQVRYTKIAEQVREKTMKSVSDRTVQRVGKEELAGRKARGKKRTADECKHMRAETMQRTSHLV